MSSKERLSNALEALERHMCAIDETQAEFVASLEQLRKGQHDANNHLTGIKGELGELVQSVERLERASSVDLEEIKEVQKRMAGLSDGVDRLTGETGKQYVDLDKRVRVTERFMSVHQDPKGSRG